MLRRFDVLRIAALAVALILLLPLILTACGDDDDDDDAGSSVGELVISDVWSRPAILLEGDDQDDAEHGEHDEGDQDDEGHDDMARDEDGTNGVVYMRVENEGDEADRLVSASSAIASAVELHTSSVTNGVMQMRPAEDGVEIPAGETVVFEQGGYHMMLVRLHEALDEGDTFEVELTFENAGSVTVESEVRVE